jgi:hypothetical protein
MRVAPSPETDIRDVFNGLDLGAEYRVELIDDRITVRNALSLQRCLILTWLVHELRHVTTLVGWMGLGVDGPIALPSGDLIRPDLTIIRHGHADPSGVRSEHVRLVSEIVADDDDYEAEGLIRDRCAQASIPFYLCIDTTTRPPSLTLYTTPLNGEYQGMTRVVVGDELELPDPLDTTLDTTTLPLS